MNQKVLLITPPFTQLNTPYPATAYLKGYLNTLQVASAQADLGIEVILELFSARGLTQLFDTVAASGKQLSENARRICNMRDAYLRTIDHVIAFLQDRNPTLTHLICTGNYLPEAARFEQLSDLDWAFGTMGTRDKARHLATLYLEDISDLIVEAVDPHFGFSRYAERLGRSAASFDELHGHLNRPDTYTDQILLRLLSGLMDREQPSLVALSVPFPGNLYAAFKCAQWIKKHYPEVSVCLGGGFANTELRSVSDIRVFSYFDFITLDDGEAPVTELLKYLDGKLPADLLKRTFLAADNKVVYCNGSLVPDVRQKDVGTPDYSGLPLDRYLSVIEIANPMHRLWSDGRWNKLTLAHGCYWGKCTFCDISLDYIKTYEAASAKIIVDRIEALIAQTGQNGFHFVDEAAPPAMMRELALEILRRRLTVIWWTNIRFEKSFSADLCQLLAASGCIAVSGGLEVASDRLLELICKGVTVDQVARVADNLTSAGIMVHAYLMYGFPTQTVQETIDALEIVRQLFAHEVLQSAFWHRFAMTAHAPVGMAPEQFGVRRVTETIGTFANNDLEHTDPTGAPHERFGEGLRKSLFNYMHGMCFDWPLQEWFDFRIPATSIPATYIESVLTSEEDLKQAEAHSKVVWLGGQAVKEELLQQRKGKQLRQPILVLHLKKGDLEIVLPERQLDWLRNSLDKLRISAAPVLNFQALSADYEAHFPGQPFSSFWESDTIRTLRDHGLLLL